MKEAEVTYAELAKRLKKHGFEDETEAGTTMKLKRGTFFGHFFSGMCCRPRTRTGSIGGDLIACGAEMALLVRLLVIASLFCSTSATAQSEKKEPPQTQQQTKGTEISKSGSQSGFFSKLHFVSSYCTSHRANEQAEWRKKFICEAKITDVVIAIFTVVLTGFTGLLVMVGSRQARLTSETLVFTQRAFVFPKAGSLLPAQNVKTNQFEAWLLSIVWENSGDTPTRNLRITVNISVREDLLPEDFDFADTIGLDDTPTLIGPKAVIASSPLAISHDQIRQIGEGKLHLYSWGWAEYDDVFPNTSRHRTEFCYKWHIDGALRPGGKWTISNSMHSQHNGADEECMNPVKTASLRK